MSRRHQPSVDWRKLDWDDQSPHAAVQYLMILDVSLGMQARRWRASDVL